MGRPPKGARAMTGAERLRLFRERQRQAPRPTAEPAAAQAVKAAREHVEQAKAAFRAAAEASCSESAELTAARADLAEALAESQRLQAALAGAHAEIERLQAALAAKPKAAPPVDGDERAARLQETNSALRKRIARVERVAVMPAATYHRVMRCLHPDGDPTDVQREEACGLFSQWKQSVDRARR